MIRIIVFDFDGTLALSNGIKRNTYFDVSARFGQVDGIVEKVLALEPGNRAKVFSKIVAAIGASGRGAIPGNPAEVVSDLVRQYTTLCEERIAVCPEVPGAEAELNRLRGQGYALFINSATPTEPLRRILSLRGLTSFFKGILGSPAGKSENLSLILASEGVLPSEMVLVGDNEVDRVAAIESKCHFIGIENEYSGYSLKVPKALSDYTGFKEALDFIEGKTLTNPFSERPHD